MNRLQNIFKSEEGTGTSITKPHDTATHVVVVCPISKMQELPLRGLLRGARSIIALVKGFMRKREPPTGELHQD